MYRVWKRVLVNLLQVGPRQSPVFFLPDAEVDEARYFLRHAAHELGSLSSGKVGFRLRKL